MIKRITLVRPSYSAIYSVYGNLPKNREIRPPLALLYIAAVLEKDGHIVTIIDGEPELMSVDRTFDEIIKNRPEIVGFTSTTPEFHFVEILAKKIKEYGNYSAGRQSC